MTIEKPEFVLEDKWQLETVRYNGVAVSAYSAYADPKAIKGWVDNPRIEMILNRWRNKNHMSSDAYPDDEELLTLMLDDDAVDSNETFAIQALGEDVKLNGVREPLVVTWDGTLLDGNRRKFAVMWALTKGGADHTHRQLLSRIPIRVLPDSTTADAKQSILIQENYAPSMKKEWPPVVTNRTIHKKYQELCDQYPKWTDLQIRQELHKEYPRFNTTNLRDRIEAWNLIEKFKAEYIDDMSEDDLDRLINTSFNYFYQAVSTYRNKSVFKIPEFEELLFKGMRHELFPSFASVRSFQEIYESPEATEKFLDGIGLPKASKDKNFRESLAEARRAQAEKDRHPVARLEDTIDFLNNLTSKQLSEIPDDLKDRLAEVLQRIIAQVEVTT